MADKEVTTFVVDIGPHMKQVSGEDQLNDLEVGLKYVNDILVSKAMRGRKTDYVLGLANGTNESSEMRDFVRILHNVKAPVLDDLHLYDLKVNENVVDDDLIMASLMGALEMHKHTNKKIFKKNLVIVTNSQKTPPSLDEEDVQLQMTNFLNDNSIKLIIIGSDFDNESISNRETIGKWKELASKVDDSYVISGKKVVELINYPGVKPTRPTKLFEVQLRVGANLLDPELYNDEETIKQSKNARKALKDSKTWNLFQSDQTCLSIPVEGYPAVRITKPPSFKVYGLNEKDEAKPIKAETNYEIRNYNNDMDNLNEIVNDDKDDILAKNYEIETVERENLVEGFRYGKTTVVLNEILKNKKEYRTVSGLDIRGIVDNDKIPRAYMSEDATLILGSKDSTNDQLSIAALVDVLTEMRSYAIARFVKSPTSEVQMVVLIPVYIKKHGGISTKRSLNDSELIETRGLVMNRLPFFEDEKIAVFPNLTTLKTTSGKIVTSAHPFLPTPEIDSLMDSIVDCMDLGSSSTDIDGEKLIFNPSLASSLLPLPENRGNHDNLVKLATGNTRVQQAMKEVLIGSIKSGKSLKDYTKSEDIIPPLSKELEHDIYPDPKLVKLAKENLEKLTELLDIKQADKSKPRKRSNIVDELDQLPDDDDFVELSLEELLMKGF